jgi:DNA-binding NarL/FixJ family response regulator
MTIQMTVGSDAHLHSRPVDDQRILIVDDHLSFADLLSAALESVAGMTCVGTASTAAEAIIRADQLRPDIVIMDIQMPRQDGLLATRRIREALPDIIIVVVTAYRDPTWISRAAQAGASGFIPKNGSLTEMISVLRRVRAGQMLVAPSAFRGESALMPKPVLEVRPVLTARELEVLTYLGQGMATAGIARVMGISLHTCRGYMKSLHCKLGVSTQLEAVIKAKSLGLIDSPV